ncbi:MAG: flagellar basal body P-ring formation chaperone FlgA [Myxococcota bacterium]|nr:flagellar basal body P-ring formation chaperone FlgA [Myxococcota bacterium]
MTQRITSLLAGLVLLAAAVPAVASPLASETIRAAVLKSARASLPDTIVEVEVYDLQIRGKVEVPSAAKLTVRLQTDGNEDWLGRMAATAELLDDGRSLGTVRVLCDISARAQVAILRSPVARGQTIKTSDVTTVLREADGMPSGLVLDPANLVGRVAKRDLALNKMVTQSDLTERADAPRNHPVTLLVRNGGLKVTSPGVLRKEAQIGDLVEVLSTATRTTVYGILLTRDLVEVPTVAATLTHSTYSR